MFLIDRLLNTEKNKKVLEAADRHYATRSLYLFHIENPLRRLLIVAVEHRFFNWLILVAILANCLLLALLDPVVDSNPINHIIDGAEIYFQAIFTVEAIMKILAFGFWKEKNYVRGPKYRTRTYIRDPWNCIDFLVVILGFVGIILKALHSHTEFHLSVIRALRTFRPLRLMKQIPGMQIVIDALVTSMQQLWSVIILAVLILGTFALVGINLFKGLLRQKCLLPDGSVLPEDEDASRFCSMSPGYGRQCPIGSNSTCGIVDENPNENVTSFDNFGVALLAIFQSITLEGWTDIMYWLADTAPGFAQFYFILLILFGAFFLLNVISAVVAVNYAVQSEVAQTKKRVKEDANLVKEQMKQLSAGQKAALPFPVSARANFEMRLMYSWEKNHTKPGYKIITEKKYQTLLLKHATVYPHWVAVMGPIIDAQKPASKKKVSNEANNDESLSKSTIVPVSTPEMGGEGRKTTSESFNGDKIKSVAGKLFSGAVDMSRTAARSVSVSITLPNSTTAEGKGNENEVIEEEPPAENQEKSPEQILAEQMLQKMKEEQEKAVKGMLGLVFNLDGVDEGARKNALFFRKWAYKLSKTYVFETLIFLAIVFNTVVLACSYFPQSEHIRHIFHNINIALTVIFAFEMFIKLLALGILNYVKDPWNKFDGIIVIFSLIELGLPPEISVGGATTVFRALRLLRAFRLLRKWASLRRLIFAIVHTIQAVMPLTLLLLIFLFVFTTSGLSLYGGLFNLPVEEWDCTESYIHFSVGHCPPRSHYDTFLWSFVTSFQVVTGENWNEVMYSAIGALGWGSVAYFLLVIFFGNMVVMNLFLGACIDGFMSSSSLIAEEEEKKRIEKLKQTNVDLVRASINEDKPQTLAESGKKVSMNNIEVALARTKAQLTKIRRFEDHPAYQHNSLSCLSNQNKFRAFCARIALSDQFDYFIMAAIFASCILLAIETPLLPHEQIYRIDMANYALLGIFTIEAIVKIVAFGFIGHSGCYLKEHWNKLDFLLVVLGYLAILLEALSSAKAIRALRALRPLRVVRRFEGVRVIVESLSRVIAPVIQVGSVCVFIFLVFSILFVELYGGTFYACYDGDNGSRNLTEGTCFPFAEYNKDDFCLPNDPYRCPSGELWQNPTYDGTGIMYHFDNVIMGMMTLYEISSLELWLNIMNMATDSKDIGIAPVRGSRDGHAILFILFIVISKLFLLQLLVAVVIDVFQQTQEETEGGAFLSETQKQWVEMNKLAYSKTVEWKPKRLNKKSIFFPFRKRCRRLVMNPRFETFTLLVICANSIVLATDHYNPTPQFFEAFVLCDYVFGGFYILEMLLKMAAFGLFVETGYFRRFRNVFDFIIVVAVIVGWAFDFHQQAAAGAFFHAVISLRSLRTLRLLVFSKDVRELTYTSLGTLPALGNIVILLFLLLFMFSVMGVHLFSEMRTHPNPPLEFSFVNDYANFDDFGSAMLTLFRMSTGESWNGVMRDMAQFSAFAYPFCIIYTLIVQFCMVNIFVAIILSDMEELLTRNAKRRIDPKKSKGQQVEYTTDDYIAMFSQAWADVRLIYDRQLTDKLETFVRSNKPVKSIDLQDPNNSSVRLSIKDQPKTSTAGAEKKTNRRVLQKTLATNLSQLTGQVDMKNPVLRLPVRYFPKLLERVKQPLGISGVVTGVTRAELMKLYKMLDVPVTKDGYILYHPTLQALINNHILKDTIKHWIEGLNNKDDEDDVTDAMKEWLKLRLPGIFEHEAVFAKGERQDLAKMIAADILRNAFRVWKEKANQKKGNSSKQKT